MGDKAGRKVKDESEGRETFALWVVAWDGALDEALGPLDGVVIGAEERDELRPDASEAKSVGMVIMVRGRYREPMRICRQATLAPIRTNLMSVRQREVDRTYVGAAVVTLSPIPCIPHGRVVRVR